MRSRAKSKRHGLPSADWRLAVTAVVALSGLAVLVLLTNVIGTRSRGDLDDQLIVAIGRYAGQQLASCIAADVYDSYRSGVLSDDDFFEHLSKRLSIGIQDGLEMDVVRSHADASMLMQMVQTVLREIRATSLNKDRVGDGECLVIKFNTTLEWYFAEYEEIEEYI